MFEPEEPPIRQAIHITQLTLIARAANYRNLVVIISLGASSIFLFALITWNASLLLWILCIVHIVNGWLFWDSRMVRGWSDRILVVCHKGNLDVELFRSTLLQLRHLPQDTVRSMLDVLPPGPTVPSEKVAELLLHQRDHLLAERIHFTSAILSGSGCCIMLVALYSNAWYWLVGFAIYLASPRVAKWIAIRWYRNNTDA